MIFLLLACPAPDTGEPAVLVEDCATAGDEDEDGLSDCADAECWLPGVCREDCTATGDEDGDDVRNCHDPDCWLPGVCADDCWTEADEDGDGLTGCDVEPDCPCEDCATPGDEDGDWFSDCDDPDCRFAVPCGEDCANGIDDDGDGRVDCEDVACSLSGQCPEVCDDLLDNDGDEVVDGPPCPPWACPADECDGEDGDGDGLVDCADPDCLFGPPEGDCTNDRDDDCDGLVDCADPDCPFFTSENCDSLDGRDADCDGIDAWDDPDCGWGSALVEQCANGADDDADGLIDCEDGECAGRALCDEVCDNHVDDDDDGLTDCWDDDCWGPACVGATAARVESGTATWTRHTDRWVGSHGGLVDTMVGTLRVQAVHGVVRVADGYGGTQASCAWAVGRARVQARTGIDVQSGGGAVVWRRDYGGIERCDAFVVSPCETDVASGLPGGGVVDGAAVRFVDGVTRVFVSSSIGSAFYARAGPLWYVPAAPVAPFRSSWTYTWYLSGWGGGGRARTVESATFPLGEGAWYYAPPAP